MFMAAHAWVACQKEGGKFISPSWLKFSIGPYLRRERDKRNYANLFRCYGVSGFKKLFLLAKFKLTGGRQCRTFDTLGSYFGELNKNQPLVRQYFETIVNPAMIASVDDRYLRDCVAVHVRLGDYVPSLRIPLSWYVGIMQSIKRLNPGQRIIIFSDGTDDELAELMAIPGVERKFYGNALADIWAISKCKLLIASDSTFSAWGAFLGNVPIIFNRRHFPSVFSGNVLESVVGDSKVIPDNFASLLID